MNSQKLVDKAEPRRLGREDGGIPNRAFTRVYRILGNDLPPLHEPNQTVRSLEFILEHESRDETSENWWLINRILDHRKVDTLKKLLVEHHQPFIEIPFRFEEYRASFSNARDQESASEDDEVMNARALKLGYIANLNGARNVALDHGADSADWVLPLDGNCYFPKSAWETVVARLKMWNPMEPAAMIPMYRLTDNNTALDFDPVAHLEHEPQIALRGGAGVRFDTNYYYGHLDKISLLERLGFGLTRTDHAMIGTNNEKKAGFVLRLSSGVAKGAGTFADRGPLRRAAIDRILTEIDQMTSATGGK